MKNYIAINSGILLFCFSLASVSAPASWVEPATGMSFIAIPKGCYPMGTSADFMSATSIEGYGQNIIADELPQHEVCIDAFFIGKTEVRAKDWDKVMGSPAPSGADSEPAAKVSYQQAQAFAVRLTALSDGQYSYRLPTEAEWEYACRAGSMAQEEKFYNNPVDIAWYGASGKRLPKPAEVAQLSANDWGLHDMLGNVWEWVADSYHIDGYKQHTLYNPKLNDSQNSERVIRGASHRSNTSEVRCGNRAFYPAGDSLPQIGFRLVREQKAL